MKTYCNPLDLGYRYQHMKEGPRVAGFREGNRRNDTGAHLPMGGAPFLRPKFATTL